jgi:hypothetical protein
MRAKNINNYITITLSRNSQTRNIADHRFWALLPVIGASLSEPHSLVAHRAQGNALWCVRSLYVRTRNFSYSDLNPTGFSPGTGYFENFQSLYSDLQ